MAYSSSHPEVNMEKDTILWVNHDDLELENLFKQAFPKGEVIYTGATEPTLRDRLNYVFGFARVKERLLQYTG